MSTNTTQVNKQDSSNASASLIQSEILAGLSLHGAFSTLHDIQKSLNKFLGSNALSSPSLASSADPSTTGEAPTTTSSTSSSQQPMGTYQLGQLLSEVMMSIASTQLASADAHSHTNNLNAENGNALVNQATQHLADVIKQINDYEDQLKEQDKWYNKLLKAVSQICSPLDDILSACGVNQTLTQLVSSGFAKAFAAIPGMPANVASILGTVTFILVIAAVSVACPAMGGEGGAAEGEEGAEAAEGAAEGAEGAEALGEGAEGLGDIELQNLNVNGVADAAEANVEAVAEQNMARGAQQAGKLSIKAKRALFLGTKGALDGNLPQQIAVASTSDQKTQLIISTCLTIAFTAVNAWSGYEVLNNVLNTQLGQLDVVGKMVRLTQCMQMISGLGAIGSGLSLGILGVKMSKTQKSLADAQYLVSATNSLIKLSQDAMTNNTDALNASLKALNHALNSLVKNLPKAEAEAAKILSHSAA